MCAFTVTGCSSKSQPANIDDRQNMVFTKHGPMELIRIYPGDSIDSIAAEKNVPVEILAAVNNMPYPYHLYNYRTIMVPSTKYHKVKGSESLSSIAKKYKVDLMHLMDSNNMSEYKPSSALPVGTVLRIPSNDSYARDADDAYYNNSKPYKPTKNYDVMEIEEVPHEPINVDETETSIEFERELRETLSEKEEEDIPHQTVPILEKPTIPTVTDRGSNVQGEVANADFKTITPLNLPQFMWPLNGKISREKKDGITIFAPLNSGIKSCGNGKVIFAANDNGEYGNLIIIKHNGGYLSAYAHINQMLVKKGDEVSKGQTIAKVGQSGKVNKPQTFFSIRKGKEILDPEREY